MRRSVADYRCTDYRFPVLLPSSLRIQTVKPAFGAAAASPVGGFPHLPERTGGVRAQGLSLQGCCLLEKLEFFVSAFAPFLHKLLRERSWTVDVQAGQETTTNRDTGSSHGPRGDGLGAGHLELETQ